MELEKAAFGMGCFWGPDALFGAVEGVKRTRVGYAGGEKENPAYRDLGDHTETVLVEYDPGKVSYRELLELFWDSHDHSRKKKPRYASKIFYTTEQQRQLAEGSMRENAATEIEPLEQFYVAEDYHQKYHLRHSRLMENLEDMSDGEFRDSALAAKLNAYVSGELRMGDIDEMDLDVEPGLKDRMLNVLRRRL